jgi:hypothetical protein
MYNFWKLAFVLTCFAPAYVAGQQPSAAEVIEHRVPGPPAVGTRQLSEGFEIAAPLPFPSILEGRDGRWIMIGSGKVCFSREGVEHSRTAFRSH